MCYHKNMRHLIRVSTAAKKFSLYKQFGLKTYRQCVSIAGQMRGTKIIHINSTADGGGVAELLHTQIPLERNLGLDSKWLVIKQPKSFFVVTKKIHNLLQGEKGKLSQGEKKFYLRQSRDAGEELRKMLESAGKRVIVVLHDPQTLPLSSYVPEGVPVIVRLHIDLTSPDKTTLNFLMPYLKRANNLIVSHRDFLPYWISKNKIRVSCPAIDPFSAKNKNVKPADAARLFKKFKISINRPIAAQISRFDKWKDPEGVIKAYYLAKKHVPELQLVLEGAEGAADDPEAESVFKHLASKYKGDPDLFLLGKNVLNRRSYGLWVNALQRRADVIIQKSLREGFGLTVTEALWKNRPVIGGSATGIKQQIQNGKNGFIVSSEEQCAGRIKQVLKNPRLAAALGRRGHEKVRQNYLFNRLLLDFLKIYRQFG